MDPSEVVTLCEIAKLIESQIEAMAELSRQIGSLSSLSSSYETQAEAIQDIRSDLAAIETRQSALIAQITSITTQAIQSSRPSNLIQVGGFVLIVTLIGLNLLGYSAMVKDGHFEISKNKRTQDPNNR